MSTIQQALIMATTSGGGGGGPLDVVVATTGETYGSVINPTIPAVGTGNSLIIVTRNDKADTQVDGGTENGAGTTLYGNHEHFFSIQNVTDGRTSVTIRTFDGGTPSDANTAWCVFEVDASGIVVASTTAGSTGSGTAIAQAYTTTEDSASAFAIVAISNAVAQSGANGWVAVPGTSSWNPFAYIEDAGASGAKTTDITLADSRSWGVNVLAYARA
jgi:hypothetical protein